VTVFIDTSVIMYAVGTDHPMKASCLGILERVTDRSLDAMISAEVIQEILHRAVALRRADDGIALAKRTMDLFAPVLPITHALMRRVPELVGRYPSLDARDAVHVATCIHEAIPEIISADRGYDQVAELRRIDPLAFAT
jgi:predicted nucleic acid-binding protein